MHPHDSRQLFSAGIGSVKHAVLEVTQIGLAACVEKQEGMPGAVRRRRFGMQLQAVMNLQSGTPGACNFYRQCTARSRQWPGVTFLQGHTGAD